MERDIFRIVRIPDVKSLSLMKLYAKKNSFHSV